MAKNKQVNTSEHLMADSEGQEAYKNTYTITGFFNKEPTAIFTVIAGIVVVLTFFANMAIYLHECIYLKYWGIDVVYATISTPDRFYRVCGVLFLAIVLFAVLHYFEKLLIPKEKKITPIIKLLSDELLEKAIFMTVASYTAFIIASVFTFRIEYIRNSFTSVLNISDIIVTFWFILIVSRRRVRKRRNEIAKHGSVKASGRLSDSEIGHYFLKTILIGALLLLVLFGIGLNTASSRNSFPVLQVEDQSYAIIYNTGEEVVLEVCDVEDGVITEIHMEKQKIVSVEGVEYEIMNYAPESEIPPTEPTAPSETESTIEETT